MGPTNRTCAQLLIPRTILHVSVWHGWMGMIRKDTEYFAFAGSYLCPGYDAAYEQYTRIQKSPVTTIAI